MKSIEKLRSCGVRSHQIGMRFVDENELQRIADEIEAEWQDSYDAMCLEIERDYMKLPVDADGVPIHVGDICEMSGERFEVRQLNTDGDYWWAIDRLGEFYIAELCHHAKQRTLEDVLREFIAAYDEWDDNAVDDRMERRDELFAKYADEIRELLGSGECEIVLGEDEIGCTAMVCSKCGKPVDDLGSPNFCPYCAARIRKVVKR